MRRMGDPIRHRITNERIRAMRKDELTPEATLAGLSIGRDRLRAAEIDLERLVHRARAAGASWEQVANGLEVTKQAAFQKYSKPRPRQAESLRETVRPDFEGGRW
jgi:hypothetical protein